MPRFVDQAARHVIAHYKWLEISRTQPNHLSMSSQYCVMFHASWCTYMPFSGTFIYMKMGQRQCQWSVITGTRVDGAKTHTDKNKTEQKTGKIDMNQLHTLFHQRHRCEYGVRGLWCWSSRKTGNLWEHILLSMSHRYNSGARITGWNDSSWYRSWEQNTFSLPEVKWW